MNAIPMFVKISSLFDKMVFLRLLKCHDVPAVCFSSLVPLIMHIDYCPYNVQSSVLVERGFYSI